MSKVRRKSWANVTYEVLKSGDEVLHAQDTGDVSGIITEEDTTKGSKGTHQVSPDGDGGLQTSLLDIVPRGGSDDSTTGHFR